MSDIDLIAGADSPFEPWVKEAVRELRAENERLRERIWQQEDMLGYARLEVREQLGKTALAKLLAEERLAKVAALAAELEANSHISWPSAFKRLRAVLASAPEDTTGEAEERGETLEQFEERVAAEHVAKITPPTEGYVVQRGYNALCALIREVDRGGKARVSTLAQAILDAGWVLAAPVVQQQGGE